MAKRKTKTKPKFQYIALKVGRSLGVKRTSGETSNQLVIRIFATVEQADDKVWENLSESAQNWFNNTARELFKII